MSFATLSGLVTALLLLAFIAGVAWAFSARRRRDFDEAAQLPLEDDRKPPEEPR